MQQKNSSAGSIARGPAMSPAMTASRLLVRWRSTGRMSQTLRLARHGEPLGKPAALVELDVHDLESADEARQVSKTQRALVRSHRDRTQKPSSPASCPRASGCSSSSTRAATSAQECLEVAHPVALVGVDPEPYVGPRGAHGLEPRAIEVAIAGELKLQRPRLRVAACAVRHARGIIGAECKGRQQGCGGSSPASSHTGRPLRRASSSHRAQSSALRAPPAAAALAARRGRCPPRPTAGWPRARRPCARRRR